MADAKTPNGRSKLVTEDRGAIHVVIEAKELKKFRDWCKGHGTTPTTKVREMIIRFNEVHAAWIPKP